MTLTSVPFLDAVDDVSAGNTKIPQSEFLAAGKLAVVDQGQSFVAGYTDNTMACVKTSPPVIVFGDHTRAFKFLDFPFAMGADGVKVLQPRAGFDPKYVYYYLRSLKLPSAGYSRHFKFLKEVSVPKPPLSEQHRIAAILDHAEALRAKRRQVLTQLDSLTQSVFTDMFGELHSGLWDRVSLGELVPKIENGTSPNCDARSAEPDEWGVLKLGAVTYGYFQAEKNKAYAGDLGSMRSNEVRDGDVLMTRKNTRELVGAVALVEGVRPRLLIPDLIFRLHLDADRIDRRYFHALLMSPEKRPVVRDLSSGSASSMPNISKARLAQLPLELPPLSLQHEFAARIEFIQAQRARVAHSTTADDELTASLQCRAFRGEL